MFKFFLSKTFLINLALTLLLAVFVIWGIFKFIDNYTHHGETVSVPQLEGLKLKEVENVLNEKNLRFVILDSIYVPKSEKGIVLEQNPIANELVKENRTIYITVTKVVPPKISMPNVVDMSQRIAIAKLESYGLKVKTKYVPSECVNCVIFQEVKGKEVKPGDQIAKGSVVTLTLGSGTSNERVMVPYLINLTKEEAISKLMESSLNIGFSDYENCKCKTPADTLNAKIYRQSPGRSESNPINMGSSVDVYLTCDPALINNPPTDTTETELPD
jgi:beta-lactam-binding protein with PASTA domain